MKKHQTHDSRYPTLEGVLYLLPKEIVIPYQQSFVNVCIALRFDTNLCSAFLFSTHNLSPLLLRLA